MIRAAIVGVSGYGRWHLLMAMEQALVGRLQLVGATIINPTEEAVVCARLKRQGVPVFETYEAMLAALTGRVDLILLPTGIRWHASMTIAALRAGANVLVEKPIAATLQDVDEIIREQAKSGRLVAVGFQDLYVPATHDIKRRVLAGEIGPLRRVTVCGQWPRTADYYARNSWAGRLREGDAWVLDSPASNALAHFLMLALFWAGPRPETAAEIVEIEADLIRVNDIESFDTIGLRARAAAGVDIFFYGSHAGRENRAPEIRLIGERGEISWVYESEYQVSGQSGAAQKFPVPQQLDTRLSVLEAVVRRLRGEAAFIVEPALARTHTRVLNALHEFFPIAEVAPAFWEATGGDRDFARCIKDLDATIAEAAQHGKLFGEMAVPWATKAQVHSLLGYEVFGGCWPRPRPGTGAVASNSAAPLSI